MRLNEVTLMRSILALLIVFMHSFTCYNGSWDQPAGYVDIPLYKWLARLTFAFTLECFVFISGYLMAFQQIALNRCVTNSPISFFIHKLKRLILPSVLFSILYFVIFYRYTGIGNMLYNVINGCGHMWFLPMLFWCFVGAMLLLRIPIGDRWKLALLVILNFFTIITLPLRISEAFTFIVYFYSGFLSYKYFARIKHFITRKSLTIMWLVFILLFVIFRPLRDVLVTNESQTIFVKFWVYVGNNISQFLYAYIGLAAFYATAVYYVGVHDLKPFVIKLAACSFGIYLLHQFILQLIYYKTSLPAFVGPYILPWIGFIAATFAACCISNVMLRTRSGKLLIG